MANIYIKLNYCLNELENTKRVVHNGQSVSFNWFIVSDNILLCFYLALSLSLRVCVCLRLTLHASLRYHTYYHPRTSHPPLYHVRNSY